MINELACEGHSGFEGGFPRSAIFTSYGVQVSIRQLFGSQMTLKEAMFIMEGIEKAAFCQGYREEAKITAAIRSPGGITEPVAQIELRVCPGMENSTTDFSDLNGSATTFSNISVPVEF